MDILCQRLNSFYSLSTRLKADFWAEKIASIRQFLLHVQADFPLPFLNIKNQEYFELWRAFKMFSLWVRSICSYSNSLIFTKNHDKTSYWWHKITDPPNYQIELYLSVNSNWKKEFIIELHQSPWIWLLKFSSLKYQV